MTRSVARRLIQNGQSDSISRASPPLYGEERP
jgi:hypothetical protein